MRSHFKVAASGLSGVVLLLGAGCQSTVHTETRFLPPATPDQMACVDRCYQTDRDCVGSRSFEPAPGSGLGPEEAARARESYDQCSKRAQAEYEQCQSSQRNSGSFRGTCYRQVCLVDGKVPASQGGPEFNDADECAKIFNACFTRCGGRIETREVCEGVC